MRSKHHNNHTPSPSPINPITLQTPRLLLRAARPSDLQAMHSLLSDPEIMQFWSGPPFTSIEQSRHYLAQMLASPNNGTLDFVLVLVPPTDYSASRGRRVIGKAGIWTATTPTEHHPRGPEIGLMLQREYWGRGYMREAMQALIPQFWRSRVTNVIADVDPRNERSLGLLRRCGFVEVGREERTIETHLGWCDSVFLELSVEDQKEGDLRGGRSERKMKD